MGNVFKMSKEIPFPWGGWKRLLPLGAALSRYVTARKLRNALKCEVEVARRVARRKSFPYSALIETTNVCNLRCRFCPTGANRDSGRQKSMVDLAHVRSLLDQVGAYLFSANLYNWGEPFLNPRTPDIVNMVHEKGIFTSLSSNLNIRDFGLLDRVCEAGLDHMVVSCSGASQSVYEQFHQNGDLSLLLNALGHILEFKRSRNRRLPIIELHYLLFKHNLHEVRQAQKLFAGMGVDIFRCMDGAGPSDVTVGVRNDPKYLLSDVNYCHQLWHLIVLHSDGGIGPCYYLYFKCDDFAHISEDAAIKDILLNEQFTAARKLFHAGSVAELPPSLQHPCLKCVVVHRQRHLHEYLEANPYAKLDHLTGDY